MSPQPRYKMDVVSQASQYVVPVARAGVRLYATWRLNWLITVAVKQAVPGPAALTILVQGGVRLIVAARINSRPRGQAAETQDSGSSKAALVSWLSTSLYVVWQSLLDKALGSWTQPDTHHLP